MNMNETTIGGDDVPTFTDGNTPLDAAQVVEIVLKSLIYGAGVVGNVLVIFLILLLREHRKVSHWYLLQLALTDFLFLQTIPFNISQGMKGYWIYPVWACKALQSVRFINYYCSIIFLMVMALDRYLAVCQGLSSGVQRLRSNKYAYLITISTWTLAILLSIPVILYSAPSGVSPGCICTIHFPKDPAAWCKAEHFAEEEMDFCIHDVFPSIHQDACLNIGLPGNNESKNQSVGLNTSATATDEIDNIDPNSFLPDSAYTEYFYDQHGYSDYGFDPDNSPPTNGIDNETFSGTGSNNSGHEIHLGNYGHYYNHGKLGTEVIAPKIPTQEFDSVSNETNELKNTTPSSDSGLKMGTQNLVNNSSLWKRKGKLLNLVPIENKCEYDDEGDGWTAFLLFNFVMMFVLPLLIIAVCYSLIIKRLTKSVAGNTKNRERKRVTVMLAVLIVLFIACWLPYHSVHIAKIIGISRTIEQSTLCTALSRITLILPYLNSALNPYLYNFLGTFRKRVRQIRQHSGVQSFLSATKLTKVLGRSSTSGQGSNSDSSRPKRSSLAPDFQQESLPMKTFRSERST